MKKAGSTLRLHDFNGQVRNILYGRVHYVGYVGVRHVLYICRSKKEAKQGKGDVFDSSGRL